MNKKGRNKERIKKIKEFQEQRAKENRIRETEHAKWLSKQREAKKESAVYSEQGEIKLPQPTISNIPHLLNNPGLVLLINSLKEAGELINPEIFKGSNVFPKDDDLESVLEILESMQENKQAE